MNGPMNGPMDQMNELSGRSPPPAEHVAVGAQQLGLELLFTAAPRLHEVVLLGGGAAAREAVGEPVVALPP